MPYSAAVFTRKKIDHLVDINNMNLRVGKEPVSYTHLDVYKRQVLARPGLAVLKRPRCPWVLCECGFITNPENAALMKDHPEAIAEALSLIHI